MCSSPTEMRTMSGSTPAASCCAASSWRCVVLAGWLISVRVSPMFDQVAHELRASMNLHAGLRAALDAERQQPRAPAASRASARTSACCGWSASPG